MGVMSLVNRDYTQLRSVASYSVVIGGNVVGLGVLFSSFFQRFSMAGQVESRKLHIGGF